MQLRDFRDYVSALGIAEDGHCYCGKMADKKEKSIGVYPLKSGRQKQNTLGGEQNCSYETKGISILVHWNKSPNETETAAMWLLEALTKCENVTVNGHEIKFIQVSYDEPIPVGTDENGIYEYIIECLLYVKKG